MPDVWLIIMSVCLSVYLAAYLLFLQDALLEHAVLNQFVGSKWVRVTQGGKSVRIAGVSTWPNDQLGNAMADGWLHFTCILFTFYLQKPCCLAETHQAGGWWQSLMDAALSAW